MRQREREDDDSVGRGAKSDFESNSDEDMSDDSEVPKKKLKL